MKERQKDYEWDEEVAAHDPHLYDFAGLAETINGFDAIDEAAIARYDEQGFLAIENAYTVQDMADATQGLIDLMMEKNPDFSIIQFRSGVRERLSMLSLEERLDNIRKIGMFTDHDERLKRIAFHPMLVTVLRRFLGGEAELYQSMALIKPPHGREKPWHQDHAYFDLSLDTRVVGIWIAVDDATPENGCMRVVPGGHRRGVLPHHMERDWQLSDEITKSFSTESLAVPLKSGGCMIFDSFLPHGTPANFSTSNRKALQYHYFKSGLPRTPPEYRLSIWS